MNGECKKKKQLGMAQGTARNRLIKALLFDMACKLDLDWCYQCGAKIEFKDDLSIEHMTPWLDSDNPIGLYFDLDNIAFSHHGCNSKASRSNTPTMKTLYGIEEGDGQGHCTRCHTNKPSDEMMKSYRRVNGLDNVCKKCKKISNAKRT